MEGMEGEPASLAKLLRDVVPSCEKTVEELSAVVVDCAYKLHGEQLTVLLEPRELNWKARRVAELALMEDLVPLLKKRAAGREISGLSAYES